MIWPLGVIGWTGRWTLLSWCELRADYRSFRFDRFHELEVMEERFTTNGEISIAHYLRSVIGIKDFG